MKKFLAIVLALVLVLSIGSVALAAEPQTAADIMAEFYDAPGNAVNIELKNDISDSIALDVPEGKTLTISGNYTFSYIQLSGAGRIDLKVKEITKGLSIFGTATVNVEAQAVRSAPLEAGYDEEKGYWTGSAFPTVMIGGDATVSIKADIIGGNGTLPGAALTSADSYANGGAGLMIMGDAPRVTVVGNITGGNAAGAVGVGGMGIALGGTDALVTVTGNVTGGNVNADPTVEPATDEGMAGYGIAVEGGAPTVKVNGNVTGGHTNGYDGDGGGGVGLVSEEVITVTVSGDVTGGNATGAGEATAGPGIMAIIFNTNTGIEADVITVGGTVAAGQGKDNAAIYYGVYGDLPNPETVLDYDRMKADGVSDQWIVDMINNTVLMYCREGFFTEEEVAEFRTQCVKIDAAALNYELPADYKATVNMSTGSANRDEHTEVILARKTSLTTEESEALYAEIAPKYVDAWKELWRKSVVEWERFVVMPLITAWQILPGDSGLIYTTEYDEEKPENYELDMKILELYSADTITYTVKVADAQGGIVTADKKEVKAGETVTLKSTADAGYTLGEWKVYGKAIEGNTFEARVGGGILVEAAYVANQVNPPAEETEGNPPTGDGAVWFALLAVTALAGAAVLIRHREKA